MFGSRQGQPPSHLPAISRPSSGDLDSHQICLKCPEPTTQPSGFVFNVYCMGLCRVDVLFVLGVIIQQVFSQSSPSNLPAIFRRFICSTVCLKQVEPTTSQLVLVFVYTVWFSAVLMVFVCIWCSNTTGVLPSIYKPSPIDKQMHPKSLDIARANHPAISRRSTITIQLFGTRCCQPPNHLPAIVQRFRITPAIFGNSQGQPPSHLPPISQPSLCDLDVHEKCS